MKQPEAANERCTERRYLRVWLSILALAFLCLACDRNIEPYRPGEEPSQPDLSRIFPQPDEERSAMAGTRESAPPMARRASVGPSDTPAGGQGAPSAAISDGASSASAPVRGRIELAPEHAGTSGQGAILFIIARKAGRPGPPFAALRFVSPRFPMDFEIGPEQVLMPAENFEGAMELSARLDFDGDPMTKLPGDLSNDAATNASPGDSGVILTLSRKL